MEIRPRDFHKNVKYFDAIINTSILNAMCGHTFRRGVKIMVFIRVQLKYIENKE